MNLFLTEEIGELAGAVRRVLNIYNDKKKISLEGEIMDVLSYILQLANMYKIDLDNSLET